ncbi:protein Son-like [Ochlerotatus camptorhynchus]|uniref:protein Son-like n=1 Tax=Ochlerotatus camptorhynchus TaxID=644619 RepID=UPI0031D88C4D
MKPTARVSPTSGSRNDYTQYNMNSGRSNNTNYNNSGSGSSNLPYYMYNSSTSGGNNSSNFNYNYSASRSYSANNNNPSNSYEYESQLQSALNFQYNPIISSDTSSHVPFSYANNESNSGKRKNRGYQPWVKRDSLQRPAPYAGHRGMTLMQKMGWNPGQGLGRCENGELEPSFPDIKMNKRGLHVGQKELKVPVSVKSEGGQKLQMASIKLVTEGKNPVSILEEYCSKRKLEAPKYEAVVDEGPVHAKNFVFKVSVDGVDYTADKGSNVKKIARLEAAKKCLVELGILSKE